MLGLTLLAHALVLTEPASLTALEQRGMGLKDLVGVMAYDDMTRAITADVDDVGGQRRRAKSRGYDGDVETFRAAWLSDKDHRFELVGALPRLDRRTARPGTCGELRLVYRLAVRNERLPMTAAVVYTVPPQRGDCRYAAAAVAWPAVPTPKLVRAALTSPASLWRRIATHAMRPTRVEVNVQLARWPYTKTTPFSDQVHYLLRALQWHADRLVPMALENTPDVARLQQDAALRAELVTWLKAPPQAAALAGGSLQVPPKFLAEKVVSVSPFGLARLANRPFSAALGDALPAITLRQLDVLSCNGCHQSRSIAGFHLLGFERGTQPAWTSLKTPWSAHFAAIQRWREADEAALLAGKSPPAPIDPERYGLEGTVGAPCGRDGTFAAWTCGTGLTCRDDLPHDDRTELGTCHPEHKPKSGDACDPATLASAVDPLADQWTEGKRPGCHDGGVCATSRNGFPGGLCARTCAVAGEDDGGIGPCVAVPTLGPFTVCLKAGGTFAACAAAHHAKARLPACEATADCRPDFVCVTGKEKGGACVPPYFLHQLTIEHRQN